mgnify:CR=1 FL=1|tara:strand:+ start:2947 stop:4092 length:1146 start_codon:yes stop_codon:yes gene_type:complete
MSQEKKEGEFSLKGKKTKPRNLGKQQDAPIKVDLSESNEEQEVTKVVIEAEEKQVEEVTQEVAQEEVTQEVVQEDTPIIQEITSEDVEEEVEILEEQLEQAVVEQNAGINLPENIEKLVSFMEETGGTINDYVRLNADYSNIDNDTLLKEYYKKTKPYLDSEDLNLLIEDFSYDEDLDEDRDIRKKKLAFKEEVAKAKSFLEETKSKYYDEIKLRPGVTQEQQKAVDFFNRHNEEKGKAEQQHNLFKSQTKKHFSQDFKGFDFNLGEKKFRYGVKDPSKVAETQSDITNIVGKFLNKDGSVKDTAGYHKAMYAAANVDTIANHFYEQGKADAVKEVIDSSKNPSQALRQSPQTGFKDGIKVKVLNDGALSSSKLKIKKIKI